MIIYKLIMENLLAQQRQFLKEKVSPAAGVVVVSSVKKPASARSERPPSLFARLMEDPHFEMPAPAPTPVQP